MKHKTPYNLPEPHRYVGLTGYFKVKASTKPGESPVWMPVKILEATIAYQHILLLVEPVGGYGTARVRAGRVWLEDGKLNQCPEKPV